MTYAPFDNTINFAVPTKDPNPYRYSPADGDAMFQGWWRTVAHFAQTLFPGRQGIFGSKLDILNHDKDSNGPDIQVYDLSDTSGTSISTALPYDVANVGTSPSLTVDVKMIAKRLDIFEPSEVLHSEFVNQRQFQEQAVIHIVDKFKNYLFYLGNDGGSTPNEPDGVKRLVARGLGQTFDAATVGVNTNPLILVSFMRSKLRAENGRCDALMMNDDAVIKLTAELYTNGTKPDWRYSDVTGEVTLFIDDVPVIRNNFIPTTTDTTLVYGMCLGAPNGVYEIHPKDMPGIDVYPDRREDAPVTGIRFQCYTALVSHGDDLVELTNFSTALA